MEGESVWNGYGELEVIEEEVESSLETRQRRRGKVGNGQQNGGAPVEKKEEEHRSVFLDSDQGIEFNDITAGLGLREADQVAAENPTNGKADATIEEFNNLANIPVEKEGKESDNVVAEELSNCNNPTEEEQKTLENGIVEIGSGSCLNFEKNIGSVVMQSVQEIEEFEESSPGKFHKVELAEFDVERVLEEQETHDLYCPNCNSCITKRVILRKRKRIVRDSQHDLPPEKLQNVYGSSAASAETPEVDHEDESVFRCLSCFSFFISTDGGFNIFRLFGKREASKTLQSSEQVPLRNTNWVPSIFRSEASEKKGTEAGISSPHESSIIPGKQMGGSSISVQAPQTTTVSNAGNLGVINIAGDTIESYTSSSENPTKAKQIAPTQTITRPAKLAESHDTFTKDDAGSPLPYKTNVVACEDPSVEVNQVSPSLSASEVEESYTSSSGNPAKAKQIAPTQNITRPAELADGHNIFTKDNAGSPLPYKTNVVACEDPSVEVNQVSPSPSASEAEGDGTKKPILVVEPSSPRGTFESTQNINGSVLPSSFPGPPDAGYDVIKPIGMVKPTSSTEITQTSGSIHEPMPHTSVETLIDVGVQGVIVPGRNNEWDVLKSIVYGGLIESITSLGVVSSAAGADASTLNICALGIANLVGGLFVIGHDISELRSSPKPEAIDQRVKQADRYWDLLGRREHYRRHIVVAILSYIIFGLLPPVIYGFSFRKSDNKENKVIAVAAASLLCIALLGIGKAHVKSQKDYFKTLLYYLMLGVSASGLSYVAGVFIDKLLVDLGVYDQSASPSPPPSLEFLGIGSGSSAAWASL
ncbi:membrane protein of ER body-like protein isoform X3 [Iris pallida]|uniref:Membrane protein of ER body-like protein isoform X3 n=1 Tax=Iris pallida TaxID=29817 RepID=A0AAX6IFP9_IRIPA|nr:membrane protein of ER body-like protein isoform X3 [Iris pallida]